MKRFLAIIRQPGDKKRRRSKKANELYTNNLVMWFNKYTHLGNFVDASDLNQKGIMLYNSQMIKNDVHRNGKETVSGFIMVKAFDLEHAVSIMSECPLYDDGAYVELREVESTATPRY